MHKKLVLEWSNFRESLLMALAAIRGSKLRSILTLLGVTVGVFSIISVMTAVGVLRNSIEEGITQLGANTFVIEKFPRLLAATITPITENGGTGRISPTSRLSR